nr:MAG TPA: hypothetical protein [Inoviridae sp.]
MNTIHTEIDVIEPIADPCPGPDGRTEFVINGIFSKQESTNENQTEPE